MQTKCLGSWDARSSFPYLLKSVTVQDTGNDVCKFLMTDIFCRGLLG